MIRRALTWRWFGWFAAATAFAVMAYLLGQWQWGRYEDRSARADRIEANYDAPPVAIDGVLDSAPVPLQREWTRVTATGTYDDEHRYLVRNRPHDGTYGYEVVVPLRLDDGTAVLVDRGWVPNSDEGATVAPQVAPSPGGEVTVTGWVRPSEPADSRDLPQGQTYNIDVPTLAERSELDLRGGYLILQEDGGSERPAPLERPDTGIGPHMAYAIQWWLAIPAAYALIFFALRREHQGATGTTPVRAVKPKKTRIWDEEDG